MPVRPGVITLLAVVLVAHGGVVVATRVIPEQTPVSVAAAVAEGRTDEELVLAAAAMVTAAQAANDRPGEAAALELLGQVHAVRGEYAEAEHAQQRAVAIWSDIGDNASLSHALELLADAQLRRRVDLDVAGATIERLRALRAPLQSRDPIGFTRVLELDATLQTRRGQYVAAREMLTRITTIVDVARLPAARQASLAYLSGDVAYLMGDMSRATADWDTALNLARRAYGPTHPAVIEYLGRAAKALHASGDVENARNLRSTALQLAEGTLPRCHTDAIGARNDIASSDEFFGDYAGARHALEDALASSRKCFGPSHPATAQALGNVGYILSELGDLSAAEANLREAVNAWTAARGASHPMVALALEQLGEVVARAGRAQEALTLYQRALAIRTQALGDDHPLVAQVLAARAKVLTDQRRFSAALRDLDRAAAIYQRQGTFDTPEGVEKADVQLRRGDVYRAAGRLDMAREAYAAALAVRERIFGGSHPRVAEARTLLARIDVERGAEQQAFAEAVSAENVSRDHLRGSIRYLPERQALEYASAKPPALDLVIAIARTGDGIVVQDAFDSVIRSRGLVLDELAARAQLGHSDAAVAPDAMQRFITARQRYANLTVQSVREPVSRERLEAARKAAEDAETLVAQQSGALRAARARADAGLEQVLAALPPDSALVAFVRYELPAGTGRSSTSAYGAFVVGADRKPVFVRIGTAARIDGLVRSWRAQVSRRSTAAALVTDGAALRTAVWDPVVARAGNADRIFIVGDGALSLVSFAALPRRGGGYLVEDDRVLHVLSTERDLLLTADDEQYRSALIVGGPAFTGNRSVTTLASARAGVDCRSGRPLAFTELPGARAEAQTLSSLWSNSGSRDVIMLSGAEATETAVKERLSGRRVVHLATHGFFLGLRCDRDTQGTRAVGGVIAAHGKTTIIRNPLSLSGLAFAGANREIPGATDDGILTAQEIASLDLRGTEWAVLSACDTGLGEIRSGEGVLGLRRAFQIAGARTVIMSLWSVDDQATRRWMQSLYEARLTRHLDTAAAVRAASVQILTQRRAARLSTHPFYWAAFVAAGDWR